MTTDTQQTEAWLTAVYGEVQPPAHLHQAVYQPALIEPQWKSVDTLPHARGRVRRVAPSLAVGVALVAILTAVLGGSLALLRTHATTPSGSQQGFVTPSPFPTTPPLPPGGWTVATVPMPRDGATLQSVSCVSSTFCMAAGGGDAALIEEWDGKSWSILPSPTPGTGSALDAVSCASTTFCTAVGSYASASSAGTLLDVWDGISWEQNTAPGGSSIDFNAVSCPTPTFCVVVGQTSGRSQAPAFPPQAASASLPPAQDPQSVIVIWNGSTWTLERSTPPFGQLTAVRCTSATFCMAVGPTGNCTLPGVVGCDPQGAALAEVWDGRRWTLTGTSGSAGGGLSSVDCTSPSFCIGGGDTGEGLPQVWNGHVWRGIGIPDAAATGSINAVACASPQVCTLITAALVDTTANTLQILNWDGRTLQGVRAPRLAGSQVDLFSVAVLVHAGRTFQVAVGIGAFPTNPLGRPVVAMHT